MARLLAVALLALAALVPPAVAADPPPGAEYSEEYIADGPVEKLHADVFRPKGVAKAPVIVTVSPYTGHATAGGSTPPYDPNKSGPNERFYDFLQGGQVLERGYAYVMVDLPGYGGSSGCGDWGGPREQQAVKTAVEWAAKQPWSTGKVALFGKSYDAWTGIMGLAQKPAGLSAVVSMEPVYSGYRYFWTNGIRISNTFATPQAFRLYDVQPGSLGDDPTYQANQVVTTSPACQVSGPAIESADPDEKSIYWEPRNLLPKVKGSPVPLFLTQGFLEDNTKPDGAFDVFNGVTGAKRAWFGQFGHWRGYEREGEDGPYKTGRDAFMDQLIRFLEEHLRGAKPATPDAPVEVQSAPDGKWRPELAWPPSDATGLATTLKTGSFTDDGDGSSTDPAGGVWSVSQPFPYRARLAGEPVVKATVSTPARANVVVNLYDVGPDGKALLISRTGALAGSGELELKLYGQDWVVEPEHRIAVRFTDANTEWWRHVPTSASVSIEAATITLPWLTFEREQFLATATPTPDLDALLGRAFDVPADLLSSAAAQFELPRALVRSSVVCACPLPGRKLTLKVKRGSGRTLTVSGRAPDGLVMVRALQGRKISASRRIVVRGGKYSVKLKLRKKGAYVVRVDTPGGQKLTKKVKVR
jgi:predicted acyl esterase